MHFNGLPSGTNTTLLQLVVSQRNVRLRVDNKKEIIGFYLFVRHLVLQYVNNHRKGSHLIEIKNHFMAE